MGRNDDWLQMEDLVEIYIRKWIDTSIQPIAIVQLAHGMAEHIERYDEFASFLLKHRIFVIGNDHRGHGKTGEKAKLFGYFADENGFDRATKDLYQITNYIRTLFPKIPLFLMGHSMGSFLVRRYIQQYSDMVQGVILSGTAGNPGIPGKLGQLVAKWEMIKHGKKAPSPVLDQLIFGSYNKPFPNESTKFAWLSRNEEEVAKYLTDPYCGFVCTSGFYFDLLTGLATIHQNARIEQIRKDLPMLFISGKKDPVGANGKGVQKAIKQYKRNGIENIETIFYEEGRHEVLMELNKNEVYDDIYQWLSKQIETVKTDQS
ncbi:lysophospholipase [Caldibacillus lycopersici]|uniref:Lysophospholipase n=1 Tax=Perspicuibacillus lycopersici TaxID=1325689 RepID=A0AAE3IV39_9BACI|nr:alpha/beta hydrolase [Perspicuibacillus lycopersici]MCU9614762.1 lysophospholipase [Perspicuibacillus lycopersici]